VTGSKDKLPTNPNTPAFELENVAISFCSQAQTINGKQYPKGFQLSGECTINGHDVQLQVDVSAQNGLQFQGIMKDLEVGPVTIDKAELDFQINPKEPQQNTVKAIAKDFTVPDLPALKGLDLEVIYNKTQKCAMAQMKTLDIKMSDICAALSFLDFDFSNLRFTVASEAMSVEFDGKNVKVPKGEYLSGVATWCSSTI